MPEFFFNPPASTGPDTWGVVSQHCDGKSQSPVNIVTRRVRPDERLTPFHFIGYQDTFHGFLRNNGHSGMSFWLLKLTNIFRKKHDKYINRVTAKHKMTWTRCKQLSLSLWIWIVLPTAASPWTIFLMLNDFFVVQLDLPSGIRIRGGNLTVPYKAIQLHLHWGSDGGMGSEHLIDGEQFPMEVWNVGFEMCSNKHLMWWSHLKTITVMNEEIIVIIIPK